MMVGNHMAQTGESQVKTQEGCRTNEGEEITIVASADAVVQPHTMVIQSFDTIVAHSTMIASRWSPDIAALAVFHRYIHGGCLRSSQAYHDPIISWGSKGQRVVVILWWKCMDVAREYLRTVRKQCEPEYALVLPRDRQAKHEEMKTNK